MSTHKHIDKICLVAALLALLITVLFMNGAALGLTAINSDDEGSGYFTANDLNGSWNSSDATKITLTGDGGKVTGNGAYIYNGDVHIIYAGKYVLSGELTDGQIIIDADGDDKVWLLLDGVSLHCEDSAAIVVEQAKKVFLTLAGGTVNSVSSGAAYSEEAVAGGIDGAIYSRDDLTINGSGSLTVAAPYQHGIVCNDSLVITGGMLDITAAQDGIHANDSVRIADAGITINASDDGITVSNDDNTAYFYMESGSVAIPSCYEGIEAIEVTIAGGTVNIVPTDDGINANGQGRSSIIRITGGDITIINPTGRDADGLDSNGSIDISGGTIFISVNGSGSNCALDCGTENGGTCTISGGTVIAAGGSTMAEGFDASSEQCFIMYTASADSSTEVTLTGANGTVVLSGTIPCSFSSIILSAPELTMGEVCTLAIGGTETQITVNNASASVGGFGMGGMGGTFDGRGGMGGRGGMDRFAGAPGTGGNMSSQPSRDMDGSSSATLPSASGDFTPPDGDMPTPPGGEMPTLPDGNVGGDSSASWPFGGEGLTKPNGETEGDGSAPWSFGDRNPQFGGRDFAQSGSGSTNAQSPDSGSGADSSLPTLVLLAASILALALGLVIAFRFRR